VLEVPDEHGGRLADAGGDAVFGGAVVVCDHECVAGVEDLADAEAADQPRCAMDLPDREEVVCEDGLARGAPGRLGLLLLLICCC